MSLVFEAEFGSPTLKLVALAMADHASDDGRNIYPGYSRLSRKTEFDKSTVSRAIQSLMDERILIREKRATDTKPAKFRFDLDVLKRLGGCSVPPVGALPAGSVHATGSRGAYEPSLTIIETSEVDSRIQQAEAQALKKLLGES